MEHDKASDTIFGFEIITASLFPIPSSLNFRGFAAQMEICLKRLEPQINFFDKIQREKFVQKKELS
jgi:hypothetical protein